MLVLRSTLEKVVSKLSAPGTRSVDTETTGLHPYLGDRAFSVIIHDGEDTFYFNLKKYDGQSVDEWLGMDTATNALTRIFATRESNWYMHNAKFDMAMLYPLIGGEVPGRVLDTEVRARLVRNDHMSYSLDDCASRIGISKSDEVKTYITKHKLWTVHSDGRKDRHFDRVPLAVIQPYAEIDAEITYKLGEWQEAEFKRLKAMDREGKPGIYDIRELEEKVTKVCFRMERAGIRVDRAYCASAFEHEKSQYQRAEKDFENLTGVLLVDSPKSLSRAFDRVEARYGRTEKGNPSFTEEVLCELPSPTGDLVLKYRHHYKRAHTYFENFIRLSDESGVIHANIRQSGTATGRFSYSEPNLQNCPAEEEPTEENPYVIRKAFVPREGYRLVSIDYEAQEYKLMIDYASENELIRQIKEGVDVHQATANMMNCSRKVAKTVNFLSLYGGGAGKLAKTLGIPHPEAATLMQQYFRRLPMVSRFIGEVSKTAEIRGFIRNWAGRICWFSDRRFSYRAPNHLIQGGCADIVKHAMVKIDEWLSANGYKSKIVLQVHDELLFEVHESELHIIPKLKEFMVGVYPYRSLPMTGSIEWSKKSWEESEKYVSV